MPAALLFNLYEYRTGVWLPKAYVVGLDAGGRPREVHQTATPEVLAVYGIDPAPALARSLQLAADLRDRSVAEHFRKRTRSRPTLAGLIASDSRDRADVLRYVHARTDELLTLCRTHGFFVTANLDPRASPYGHLLAFADEDWRARLIFTLSGEGMEYRLRLTGPGGEEREVRHLDPRILTNRPAPGWVQIGSRLGRLTGLRGDALRPFLSRDVVRIPPEDVGKYVREFVARAARRLPIEAHGFTYAEQLRPTGLSLRAEPHPFAGTYLLRATVHYGARAFELGDPEEVAVDFRDREPYAVTRTVRDRGAESELLAPLYALGLRETGERRALSIDEDPAEYVNLAWILEHREAVEQIGCRVETPEAESRSFTAESGRIEIAAEERGDWLDLRGTVVVGDQPLPFARLVTYLRKGERKFLLPDGRWFLIPEAWFARYGPGLSFAQVEGNAVCLTRSHAPLLPAMGVKIAAAEAAAEVPASTIPYTPGPGLRATLRPYQLEGARWLVQHYHDRLGACLADDMGLGKTLQTIAALLYAKEQLDAAAPAAGPPPDLFSAAAEDESFIRPLRALVVLPASLVYNWLTELGKFAPRLTVVANVGSRRNREARVLRRYDVILTTYQTALRDRDILEATDLEYIVLDESQQIKNRQSKVFRALNSLSARHRISLSGTPIENSLSDLWAQMQFLNPGLLRSFPFFRKHFIQPIEQHDDPVRKQQLRELVAPYLLRRTKAEVAPDLPDLDTQVFYCEMTPQQARRYDRERAAARNALLGLPTEGAGGDYKLRVIQALTRLRQLANHPVIADADYVHDSGKFAVVYEELDTLRRAGHKVLVFSSMVKHLALYRDRLAAGGHPYAWITGDVPADVRAREVERFQEDPTVGTFFISIRAGGTGLNLTAADYVFLLDPWWNPTVEDQAIARAHRIGRRGKVFARKFLTKGTLEEKIHLLQQRKKRLATEIIGGGEGLDLEPGEIDYLLT
ncbi:DEAD/DEAH box helicase [Lewinella sp. IMCC34183]|uniref:DEAD/DEAH box helicase n=1 Tax=Lewinella sp. IMCC34183 TaxID=2248762 RepID=UPI0013006B70|nr:DEAD/DEAH box helicase [Lewinella sp. IMCC34183]